MAKPVIALLLFLFQIPAPPKPTTIQGKVVEWGTTAGISQAIVELRDMNNPGGPPAATTATLDTGDFTLTAMYPETFQIVVTRSGFAPAIYGQRRQDGPGIPLAIKEDQHLTGLTINMARGGNISGRVIDRNGQPVPFATVQALTASLQRPVQSALTNDLGEFRLFWLPPGAYYVSAEAINQQTFGKIITVNPDGSDRTSPTFSSSIRPTANITRPVGLDEGESNIPTYFPGVPDIQSADLITVGAGADVRNINLKIVPIHTRHIRGVVLSPDGSQPVSGIIRIVLTDMDKVPQTSQTLQFNGSGGKFEFNNIRPDTYQLRASVNDSDRSGVATIKVLDQDVDVSLRLQDRVSLTGSFRIEAGNKPVSIPSGIRVNMYTVDTTGQIGSVSPGGIISIPPVPVGDYLFEITPIMPPHTGAMPPPIPDSLKDAYVKSIRLGDSSATNALLHIDGPVSSPLEIVVGSNGGILNGVVANGNGEQAVNARVVLIPVENPLNRRDLLKAALTDDKGQFQLRAITPGHYRVIAWEDVDVNAWLDPNFVRQYAGRAIPIEINEGEQPPLRLTAVPLVP